MAIHGRAGGGEHAERVNAAAELERIGRWATADVADRLPTSRLVLNVYAPTTDQYGKKGRGFALALTIDPAEFAKPSFKCLSMCRKGGRPAIQPSDEVLSELTALEDSGEAIWIQR